MDNSLSSNNNKHHRVDRCCWSLIRIRFETLFSQFAKTRPELVRFLGADKAQVSRFVNGQEIPNLPMRVKISSFFPVDSSVIWENPDLKKLKKVPKNG